MHLCRSLSSSVINYLQQEQVLALSASLLSTLCLLLLRQSFPSLLSTVCWLLLLKNPCWNWNSCLIWEWESGTRIKKNYYTTFTLTFTLICLRQYSCKWPTNPFPGKINRGPQIGVPSKEKPKETQGPKIGRWHFMSFRPFFLPRQNRHQHWASNNLCSEDVMFFFSKLMGVTSSLRGIYGDRPR